MQGKHSDKATLLHRVAAGDELAFRELYDCYYPRTKAFAFRILHEQDDAEEVAQEVLLEVWQMGDRLTTIRDFDPFMKTLAKRRTIDAWRRLQLKRAAEREARVGWKEYSEATTEVVLLNETKRIIEDAIERLPPQQRTVYQLCQQQGLKYDEAAQQLDIAPATVQTHMKLALKFMRAQLRQHVELAVWFATFWLFF